MPAECKTSKHGDCKKLLLRLDEGAEAMEEGGVVVPGAAEVMEEGGEAVPEAKGKSIKQGQGSQQPGDVQDK